MGTSSPDASGSISETFALQYDIAARANMPEVEAALSSIPANQRLRGSGALALRSVKALLQGNPDAGVALLQRAIDHDTSASRSYLVEILTPILISRGEWEQAAELLETAVGAPPEISPALDGLRAVISARLGRDDESREISARALAAASEIEDPLLLARVTQRMSLAAFYRQEFGEAHERGMEAARAHENLQSYRSAALAYSVIYNIAFNYNGDLTMARYYAERISLNAKRGGDQAMHTYGLVAQFHIAAESGERRRIGSIRARLLAVQRHEQLQERSAFVLSEILMAGWAETFDIARKSLLVLREDSSHLQNMRALCDGLLAVVAAAEWHLDDARTLARRTITASTQRSGHEAQFETRARVIARYLACAACFITGDNFRATRALSRSFDPDGRLAASLSVNGVVEDMLPTVMRGYGLFINAAFASARRRRPAFGLTPAELEILKSLPSGDTFASIANARGTSRRTVERQVDTLYAKLGARNRTDAINKARDLTLLP